MKIKTLINKIKPIAFIVCLGLILTLNAFSQTIELKPNPVVSEYTVTLGGKLSISSIIEAKNLSVGTYNIRIIFKRSDNELFILYNFQRNLATGNNTIIGVDFKLEAGNVFSATETKGVIYAEIQQVSSSNNPIYKSQSISVVQSGVAPPPAPSPTDPIKNNVICCDQCVLEGEIPQQIGQVLGKVLSGAYVDSETVWELLPDGHEYSGYIANGNAQACLPYPSKQIVRYRRLLNPIFTPSASTSWVSVIVSPIGAALSGPDDPSSYSGNESNWITISISSLTPSLTVPETSHNGSVVKKAGTIFIQGDQSINRSRSNPELQADFIAARQIIIYPNSRITDNINFKIDPSIVICGSGARLASSSEKPTAIPGDTHLLNAYPNPSLGETTIHYRMVKSGGVKLFITDNSGRKILNLIDKEYSQSGEYNTVFYTNSLKSGIYFYTLLTNDYKEVKRLEIIN